MREGWSIASLGNICKIKPPKNEAKQKLSDIDMVSFVPMNDLGIREKSLTPSTERRLGDVSGSYTYFAEGDVLLAKITPCFENGKLGIASGLKNGIGFGSSEFIVLRPTNELDPEYLFYFLSQDSFRDAGARVMSGAVGHKRLPKEFIEKYPIPFPPLSEQKRIVAILDETFAGIEKAVANTEKNLANACELFESYKESIFSWQSRGWYKKSLNEIGRIKTGSTPKTSDKENYGNFVPFIKPGDFKIDGTLNYNNQALSKQGMKKARMVKADSVLMVCIGATIGKTAFATKDVVTNQQINSLTPFDNYSCKFIYYQMLTKTFRQSIMTEAGQMTLPIINKTKWSKLELKIPPRKEIQEQIVSQLDDLSFEIRRLESIYQQKLSALAELKQSLLQKAFSGELTANANNKRKEAAA